MNYQIENDEIILLEEQVLLLPFSKNTKLIITNKKILFLKKKGLFNKKLKPIEIIPLENIKNYKDKIQVKQNKTTVILQTIEKNIEFSCSNKLTAKKVVEEIINAKTGTNILQRGKKKLKKVINVVNDTKDIVLTVGAIFVALKGIITKKK